MFLKSLSITSEATVIREIDFINGLNLIVDETKTIEGEETGNNVGKTTVLMLIDYCLGGDGRSIYTDPESKKEEYKLVKNYLIDKKILITLVLKEDLDTIQSKEIRIERNFLNHKKKIQQIDGIKKTDEEFEEALTDILYPGHYEKKPTFRQIISHNIRYKDTSINNTLKTLDKFTSDVEYETLYLFLLGCDYDQGHRKNELLTKIKIEEAFKSNLEENQTKSAYETALAILNTEIEELNKSKLMLSVNKNIEQDLANLNEIRCQIEKVASDLGKLNIRKNLILQAENDLKSSKSDIDLIQLKYLYEQATSLVSGIQKTFEEMNIFHNQMIDEKVKFIVKDLPEIEGEIKAKVSQLHRLSQSEEDLSVRISQGEPFSELEDLISELNEKYRKKGEYESIVEQLNKVEAKIKTYREQLEEIDNILFSEKFEQQVQEQVNKFNQYFTKVSQILYGEKFALKFDPIIDRKGRRLYKFSAFNTNFSSGKKQGEISCFDIAYTMFADEENIPCFHFLLNDKKELMHDNQLLRIAQLVDKEKIQFVASILKDKLPNELNQEKYFVIRLSQDDKLFRIEKQ